MYGTHSRHCCDLPRAMSGSISIISADEYLLIKLHCKYVNSRLLLAGLDSEGSLTRGGGGGGGGALQAECMKRAA